MIVGFLNRHFAILVFLSYVALHGLYHRVPADSGSLSWSGENHNIAASIVQGKGFADPYAPLETGPSAWVAPPYPYLLAGVFWLAGTKTPAAARLGILLQSLLFAGTLWLLYLITQRVFSTNCAKLATFIWLISPNRIGLTSIYLSEVGFSTFSLLLAIFAFLRFTDTPTWRAAALAGLAIGFAILCLPVTALIFPCYAWAIYTLARRRSLQPLVAPVMAIMLCLTILAPWLIRNYVVFGTVVFIKNNFGRVLYSENNNDGNRVMTSLYNSRAERDLLQRTGEIAYAHYSLQRALAWIRGHKKEYLVRCVRRGLAFWVANPATGLKRWVWHLYQILFLASSAVGVWRHLRRSPVTILCCAILIVVPSIYYLTTGFDSHRLRLPFEALLTIFASTALTRSLPGRREPRSTSLASISQL